MPSLLEAETLPHTAAVPGPLDDAVRLFEQALRVGAKDPEVPYLLALCYKKLGKAGEAHAALRKLANPDGNVILQMGLLSFGEGQFAQAEQEFTRAWQMEPGSYPAAYNLVLARLSLGNLETVAEMLPRVTPLAPSEEERWFLGLLGPLLRSALSIKRGTPPPAPLGAREMNGQDMTDAEEQRLLQLLGGLGQFEAVYPLLHALAQARPSSPAVQEAFLEAVLVQAKKHVDKGEWEQAEYLLLPLARQPMDSAALNRPVTRANHVALHNLLGCCECMLQNYDRGLNSFKTSAHFAPNDPWLQQNLALAYEWRNRGDIADTHWNRYFELLDQRLPSPTLPNYREHLAFEALCRLADNYSRKDQYHLALPYLQRAARLRPNDPETLERLFHLYNQAKRPDEARKALHRLRDMRPNEPQFELYELDLREIRSLDDMERILADLRRTLAKYPNDMRVEERAVNLVNNFIPVIVRLSDQLTERLNRIVDQMRRLANHQINWQAVREEMADLIDGYRRLKRVTQKAQAVIHNDEGRRIIRDLCDQIDRKIELCQSMGG